MKLSLTSTSLPGIGAFRRLLLPALVLAASASPASAQTTYYWDSNSTTAGFGNTTGTWGTSTFWGTSAAGTGTTTNATTTDIDTVNFGTATLNYANGNVGVASGGVTVGSIVIGAGQTTGLTLGTTGNSITIFNGITKNAGSAQLTVNSPIILGAAQTWTNNSTTTLITANGTNLITNGGFDLTVTGTGNTTFGVINQTAAVLTGTGSLIKNGTGVLSLGGTNAGFTGDVVVNGGTLRVNAPASINGNLNLAGGVYEHYWSDGYTRTLGTGAGEFRITGGVSGFSENGNTAMTVTLNNNAAFEVQWGSALFNPATFVLQADTAQVNSNLTFANRLDLNGADRTIQVSGGTTGVARAIISGQIRTSTGTAGLTKTGAGMLNLTNAATAWNGNTTISGGVLDFGGIAVNTNIGGGSGRNISVAAGAGVRFNAASNALLNRLVETADEIAVMSGTTSNNLDFSSSTGANLPNAFLGSWASNGAKMEYSGTLTPAADNYRLGSPIFQGGLLGMTNTSPMTGTRGLIVGRGSVELVGPKTFTGDTVIRNGARLGLAAITGGGGVALGLQNSVLDTGTAGSTGTIWFESGGAAGPITGSVATTSAVFAGLKGSRNLSSVYSTTTGANNSAATVATAVTGFTLNPGTGVTVTYSGSLGGFGTGATGGNGGAMTLTKFGAGTQILSGVGTYTGLTTVTDGTLQYGADNVIATGGITIDGGTLALQTFSDTVGAVTLTFGSITTTGPSVLTSTVGFDVRSGLVSVPLAGGVALTKTTGGIVTLTGVNTYTGATQVNGGTLRVNGSTHASSAVTVGGAAAVGTPTLGGTGTINGTLNVSGTGVAGTLAPGTGTAGTLTAANSVTLEGGATLAVALTDNGTVGTVGGGESTQGTLPNPTSNNFLNAAGSLSIDPATNFSIDGTTLTFNPGSTYSYKIAQAANSQAGVNINDQGRFTTANFSNAGNFTFSVTGDAAGVVYLNIAPVPEPTAVGLIAFAALGLGRLFRRRAVVV